MSRRSVARSCHFADFWKPPELFATYLHFYNALSTEAIACQMHHLSVSKLPKLQRAKDHFARAALSLPKPVLPIDDRFSVSTLSQSDVDDSVSLEESTTSIETISPRKDVFSFNSNECDEQQSAEHRLKPVPLRIRKALATGYRSIADPLENSNISDFASRSPGFAAPERFGHKPHSDSVSSSNAYNDTTVSSFQNSTIRRFNEQLHGFSDALSNHVVSIDTLMEDVRKTQATRHVVPKHQKAENGDDDEDARVASLRARIIRLKAQNWQRERFNPDKYQSLCDAALNEL